MISLIHESNIKIINILWKLPSINSIFAKKNVKIRKITTDIIDLNEIKLSKILSFFSFKRIVLVFDENICVR